MVQPSRKYSTPRPRYHGRHHRLHQAQDATGSTAKDIKSRASTAKSRARGDQSLRSTSQASLTVAQWNRDHLSEAQTQEGIAREAGLTVGIRLCLIFLGILSLSFANVPRFSHIIFFLILFVIERFVKLKIKDFLFS